MKLEVLRGLGQPVILEGVTRVLILNEQNTPIGVAVEWQPGCTIVEHAGAPGFTRLLAGLGIDKTVVAVPITVPPTLHDR